LTRLSAGADKSHIVVAERKERPRGGSGSLEHSSTLLRNVDESTFEDDEEHN
jgi:hypothetical protein